MYSKRNGFTLVELLIVIIVIGILAGGMMLASGSMTDSARASALISDLRNAKMAGVAWFSDNIGLEESDLQESWDQDESMKIEMIKRMDNVEKAKALTFETVGEVDVLEDGTYTMTFALVGKTAESINVAEKAIGQAKGTLFSKNGSVLDSTADVDEDLSIYMRVK